MDDFFGEFDWWNDPPDAPPAPDPYDYRFYNNPTYYEYGQGLGNTPGTPDVSFIPISDQSKGLTFKDVVDFLKSDAGKTISAAGIAAISKMFGGSDSQPVTGYQGSVPLYNAQRQQYAVQPLANDIGTATDEQIANFLKQPGSSETQIMQQMANYGVTPARMAGIIGKPVAEVTTRFNNAFGPNQMLPRRAGAGGITHFSPMRYVDTGLEPTTAAGFTRTDSGIATRPTTTPPATSGGGGFTSGGIPVDDLHGAGVGGSTMAAGGIAALKPRFISGPGDGTSDSIPATIDGKQPARIADGEFVVDARAVAELGNGSSKAGAQKLYAMVDRIHAMRKHAQKGKPSNADKLMPA